MANQSLSSLEFVETKKVGEKRQVSYRLAHVPATHFTIERDGDAVTLVSAKLAADDYQNRRCLARALNKAKVSGIPTKLLKALDFIIVRVRTGKPTVYTTSDYRQRVASALDKDDIIVVG